MALNIFRHNPAKFTTHFKDLKKNCPEFKDDAKVIDKICADLAGAKPMLQVTIDLQASQACRDNNRAVADANEDEPEQGGNIAAYKKLKADANLASFVEVTQTNWTIGVHALVAAQLVRFYKLKAGTNDKDAKKAPAKEEDKKEEEADKKEEAPEAEAKEEVPDRVAEEALHPIMDPELKKMGLSFRGHKKVENITQIIYLVQVSNAMV